MSHFTGLVVLTENDLTQIIMKTVQSSRLVFKSGLLCRYRVVHPVKRRGGTGFENDKSLNKVHCKKIGRIYGRITGNQLPVHVPFFYGNA